MPTPAKIGNEFRLVAESWHYGYFMPQYRTIQIAIEQVEPGMTVLFPMPDGREDVPFRVKSKTLSYSQHEHSITLKSDVMEAGGGIWTITERPGFYLFQIVGIE
ncbi:hypothetical protein ACRCUN_17055 [Mycobacterium sp. LTG2003]